MAATERHIVTVAGLAVALWAGIGLLNPQLRQVEDREWIEREAARRAGAGRWKRF